MSHTLMSHALSIISSYIGEVSVLTKITVHPEYLQNPKTRELTLIMTVPYYFKQFKQLSQQKQNIFYMLPHPFINSYRFLSLDVMSVLFQMQDFRQLSQSLLSEIKLIQCFLKKYLLIWLNTQHNQFLITYHVSVTIPASILHYLNYNIGAISCIF